MQEAAVIALGIAKAAMRQIADIASAVPQRQLWPKPCR